LAHDISPHSDHAANRGIWSKVSLDRAGVKWENAPEWDGLPQMISAHCIALAVRLVRCIFRNAQFTWNVQHFALMLHVRAMNSKVISVLHTLERIAEAVLAAIIGRCIMPAKATVTVVKKYANRRLYNTSTSTYVTLEDLADMVKKGEDFTVQDAKTGEDITHPVLTQIIFELENKDGQTMLPIPFLRQLIAFYGDQMQSVVPGFLEQSMKAFAGEQERMRTQMTEALKKGPMGMMGVEPIKAVEDTVRRNAEMFQNAMKLFMPFAAQADTSAPETKTAPKETAKEVAKDDLSDLKDQIAAMQRKLEMISKS
jgi:polyhydroxyalkanoate synthesis repressor PhaR